MLQLSSVRYYNHKINITAYYRWTQVDKIIAMCLVKCQCEYLDIGTYLPLCDS